jgi:hypothetical protein
MKLESEEFPYCQLNETINMSPDGKILSKSLMINLRNQTPEVVYNNYLRMKHLLNGESELGEKVENNLGEKEKHIKKNNPGTCPQCGGLLVEKSGISKKTGEPYHFIGCANFKNGCKYTRPFVPETEKNLSRNEDVVNIEDIPF